MGVETFSIYSTLWSGVGGGKHSRQVTSLLGGANIHFLRLQDIVLLRVDDIQNQYQQPIAHAPRTV